MPQVRRQPRRKERQVRPLHRVQQLSRTASITKPFTTRPPLPGGGLHGRAGRADFEEKKEILRLLPLPRLRLRHGLAAEGGRVSRPAARRSSSPSGDRLSCLRKDCGWKSRNRRRPSRLGGRLSDRPQRRRRRCSTRCGPTSCTPAHKTGDLWRACLQQLPQVAGADERPRPSEGRTGLLGSLIVRAADGCAIPGGKALVVDRTAFAGRRHRSHSRPSPNRG